MRTLILMCNYSIGRARRCQIHISNIYYKGFTIISWVKPWEQWTDGNETVLVRVVTQCKTFYVVSTFTGNMCFKWQNKDENKLCSDPYSLVGHDVSKREMEDRQRYISWCSACFGTQALAARCGMCILIGTWHRVQLREMGLCLCGWISEMKPVSWPGITLLSAHLCLCSRARRGVK